MSKGHEGGRGNFEMLLLERLPEKSRKWDARMHMGWGLLGRRGCGWILRGRCCGEDT